MDDRELERDEVLGRVVDELRALPTADEAAVQRIVAAAAAAGRGGDADDDADDADDAPARPARVGRRVAWGWGAGVAAAAGLAGFLLGGRVGDDVAAPTAVVAGASSGASAAAPAALAASEPAAAELAPRHTQFVLSAPDARRVALVGDFNAWDRTVTPLVRDGSGLWTATIALPPGRYTYAFVVDDSTLTLDPKAPRTTDPDLGTRASVVLIGAGSP